MSITYPEAQPSRASKSTVAPAMGGGSALFPGGAANLYDRARNARSGRAGKGKGLPIAWVAAPVAVVLVGGAIALSLPHHSAQPVNAARTTVSTTSAAPAPMMEASKSVSPKAAPAPTASVTHQTAARTQSVATTRTAASPVRRASTTVSRETTRSDAAETLPAAPVPYAQTQSGQAQSAQTVQAAPAQSAPAQAVTAAPMTTPTPSNFAFTAPAAGPNGAPPAQATPAQPSAEAPAPAAATSSPQGQASPQG